MYVQVNMTLYVRRRIINRYADKLTTVIKSELGATGLTE